MATFPRSLSLSSGRRPPGFRFERMAPPLDEYLPRMDVAVFVGFAASGPLHRPVAVEDPRGFDAIFGGDVELAWDGRAGNYASSKLGPAVRSFFANGGRRCWVIRVAGAAVPNRFAIPGLQAVREDDTTGPAYAVARSEGSWSDNVRVAAAVTADGLDVKRVDWGARTVEVPDAANRIQKYDLVRLTYEEESEAYLVAGEVTQNAFAFTSVDWVPALPVSMPARPLGERLRLDLFTKRGELQGAVMRGLGFVPGHRRYWGNLPTDANLFPTPEELQFLTTANPWEDLWRDAVNPRFPLAGDAGGVARTLPVGITAVPGEFQGPEPLTGLALERNGLDQFRRTLFVDTRLDDTTVTTLMDRADYYRYYRTGRPETLRGMHAALGIEEATILAIPDASQPGWEPSDGPPAPPPPTPEEEQPLDHSEFLDCGLRIIPPPETVTAAPTGNTIKVTWSAVPIAGVSYVLEEAGAEVYRGPLQQTTLYGRVEGAYWYRVRAVVGAQQSVWSTPVLARIPGASSWRTPDEYSDTILLDVQRSMLRMCAARADQFAVLALPGHYDEAGAIAHASSLRASVERETWSYGALYHPWLVQSAVGGYRRIPPEGAACGVLARRALDRGAWIAPANEPMQGLIAMEPAISPERWGALLEAQVNVIRHDAYGFVCLAEDTLSDDPDWRPINVRRLMILLRRLALRLGAAYVFEPNGQPLRRMVQRGFEAMLERLYARGAFAGRTSAEAFQVVTDETVNPPQSVDVGRFVALIKVAPAEPLSFLTVRLIQSGGRSSVQEGRA